MVFVGYVFFKLSCGFACIYRKLESGKLDIRSVERYMKYAKYNVICNAR